MIDFKKFSELHHSITLLGMSGIGKTVLSTKLRSSANWFHYSADYRIGTRYLSEHILDNVKFKIMQMEDPFVAELLRSDSIYLSHNISVDNLQPVSTFLGMYGDYNYGGLNKQTFLDRQDLYKQAEISSMLDISHFIKKSWDIYQCKNFINHYFDHEVKLVPVSSTSRACQMALEEKNSAAICAPIAAREYKVPILYNNIQDSADNTTRFLILSESFYNEPSGEDKTSLIAKLPDEAGALVAFLQKFQSAGINLCKVESRPAKMGTHFKYIFFIELDGHFHDPEVQKTIAPYKDQIKWLGSYARMC